MFCNSLNPMIDFEPFKHLRHFSISAVRSSMRLDGALIGPSPRRAGGDLPPSP